MRTRHRRGVEERLICIVVRNRELARCHQIAIHIYRYIFRHRCRRVARDNRVRPFWCRKIRYRVTAICKLQCLNTAENITIITPRNGVRHCDRTVCVLRYLVIRQVTPERGRVRPFTTNQRVIARTAIQCVVTRIAYQRVVAITTNQNIIAIRANKTDGTGAKQKVFYRWRYRDILQNDVHLIEVDARANTLHIQVTLNARIRKL